MSLFIEVFVAVADAVSKAIEGERKIANVIFIIFKVLCLSQQKQTPQT